MKSAWKAAAILGFVFAASPGLAEEKSALKIVESRRIWDKAAHNAFTDLLRHDDRWYCVFREGSKHVSPDGSLRVITSKDGEAWESLTLISHPIDDLRDAKLTRTPDGRFKSRNFTNRS